MSSGLETVSEERSQGSLEGRGVGGFGGEMTPRSYGLGKGIVHLSSRLESHDSLQALCCI